jgi:hypothetical protein
MALRERSNWFKSNRPIAPVEVTPEFLEQSIIFYEEWQTRLAAFPAREVDLSVRKEQAGLRLLAGKWLRVWSVLRR